MDLLVWMARKGYDVSWDHHRVVVENRELLTLARAQRERSKLLRERSHILLAQLTHLLEK